MAIAQDWFFYGLAITIPCEIVIFFAFFSEVSAKDKTEQMETVLICSGGAGFVV